MIDRRFLLRSGLLGLATSTSLFGRRRAAAAAEPPGARATPRRGGPAATPAVITPDGSSLPWKWDNGVKVFHLVAEPVKRAFAPGLTVNCWGYNGQAPGPTIEAVEGDRVRILVTNKLPEATSVHWHGVRVPNGMDGVSGLNQPTIAPGETFQYEFTLRQHGTQMYHPHFDEMTQIALGMMGFFVIHPRDAGAARVDRDFCVFLHEWAIKAGTATPDPTVMLDFNVFTFNGRVFPGTSPLVARRGQTVRIRLANLSMDSHPIHLHGVHFQVTGTDGGRIPQGARWPASTVNVPPGTTRDLEFVADNPGDWALHCHKTHHTMNQMGHGLPLMLGVDTSGLDEKVQQLLPEYMAMGQTGMGGMMMMGAPRNSIPMVKEYLDEIGASEAVRRAWAEMPEPRRWREVYTKHAKTYVHVGQPAGDRSWLEPVGFGLEIVPERDPTALRPGEELPVRILSQGKPLPSFPVGLVHQGDAHGVLKTTDGQGRVTFPIDRAGRWLLRGTHLRRAAKPEADWVSDFTTVTFELR